MAASTHDEFEQQVKEIQAQRAGLGAKNGNEEEEDEENRVGFGHSAHYDTEIYGGGKFAGYATSIAPTEEQEDEDDYSSTSMLGRKSRFTAPLNILNDMAKDDKDYDPMAKHKVPRITDRQGPYQQRQLNQALSPDRHDPFAYASTIMPTMPMYFRRPWDPG